MVTLTGNGGLTKDPELRHTSTGKAVATVSVACSRRDRDADPVYVELVLWETQAELAAFHLVKGQQVAFCGRLDPRAWTGRDGAERVSLEVHGVELEYGAKPRNSGEAAADEPAAD
jgi:single-strand DNA-binding protein